MDKNLEKKLADYNKQSESFDESSEEKASGCVEVCNCNECFDYCCCCDNCCPGCCG